MRSNIDALIAEASAVLRLLGPRMSAADCLQDRLAIRSCLACEGVGQVYVCPVCDYSTEHRWQMQVHYAAQPGWCSRRGDLKVKRWAARS